MIQTFEELLEVVRQKKTLTVAVGCAQDADVLESVTEAKKLGIIDAILVGDEEKIHAIAAENGICIDGYRIIDVKEKPEACLEAVKLVRNGEADLPMKGFVDTSVFLKAVLNKEFGLSKGSLISHVGLMLVKAYGRFLLVTDSAMNLAPDVMQKAEILKNAVVVAKAIGIEEPKAAVLCAVEKVNPKMPCTLDAEELTRMNEEGKITGCLVKGPLALDNAVSPEAARHKGIDHPVAGHADILLAPDIEAGNILNKSMEYFAGAEKAGVIMGAKVPVIMTSRASSSEAKMYSIALSALIYHNMKETEEQ